jgi:SH3-like domain-containing protein
MRGWAKLGLAAGLTAAFASPLAAEGRSVPYWASITSGDALLRTGPGRNYPAVWRYRRADLPVIVLQVHESWRRVRDFEGSEGWMASVLLSAERTAMVVGDVQTLHGAPSSASRVLWRVAPGVIGKIRHCSEGWCEFSVASKAGYIQVGGLWGVNAREAID